MRPELSTYFCFLLSLIISGAWSSKILKPLGVELPLKVMKIDVLYWQVTGHLGDVFTATSDGGHHSNHSMGVFINCEDEEDIHFYGLPSYEYPGLVKVCV